MPVVYETTEYYILPLITVKWSNLSTAEGILNTAF